MIDKTIHYCWFGRGKKPIDVNRCIETWKEKCPDYNIVEWNEDNFDVTMNEYVQQAYDAKKWAFVTDFVRLYVLFKYGGIYLDTDVEVVKCLDDFLGNKAFSGFQTKREIPTGIMACEQGFPLFKEFLENYDNKRFIKENGEYDTTTNVDFITAICRKHGLVLNNQLQDLDGFVLYPMDYFCAKSHVSGMIRKTENTYTIHHFSGSWLSENELIARQMRYDCISKYGYYLGRLIGKIRIELYLLKKKLDD